MKMATIRRLAALAAVLAIAGCATEVGDDEQAGGAAAGAEQSEEREEPDELEGVSVDTQKVVEKAES